MWPSLIIVAHIIVIIGVCVGVIMMRLPVGTALAWIVMIFFLPLAGAVIQLVLGEKRLGRKRSRRAASLWGRYNRWLRELPRQVPDDQSGLSPKSAAIREAQAEQLSAQLRYASQIDGVNTAVAAIQAELDQARYYLDNTLMVAPQDGRIVNLQVRPGMVSGQYRIGAIASFICDEGRYLLANFFQENLKYVKLGQPVEVALNLYPGQIFNAKVEAIWKASGLGQLLPSGTLPDFDPATAKNPQGQYAVKIVFDSADQTESWYKPKN